MPPPQGLSVLQRLVGKLFKILSEVANEREEFMQETQHTQKTATRTAQNQDKKTT